MSNSLVLIFIYLFFRFNLCLKLHYIYKKDLVSTNRKTKRINIGKRSFLYKNDAFNNNIKKKNYKIFYKSKKEKDLLESGYLYPFDHLEKKKKKFPPDPYIPSEEEQEDSFDIYEDELDENDYLNYDDDDAKKYFGKTTFNQPNTIEKYKEHEEETYNNSSSDYISMKDESDNSYTKNMDILEKTNQNEKRENLEEIKKNVAEINNENIKENNDIIGLDNEENNLKNINKEIININFYSSEQNKIQCEMMKDKLYYLFHPCMDNIFIEFFQLNIESFTDSKEKEIYASYCSKDYNFKTVVSSFNDLIDFFNKLKKILHDKIDKFYYKKENKYSAYLNKNSRKEMEKYKKERSVTNVSKKNLQMSIESSLKLIEKCTENIYKQNYEQTLHDLKLAYNMLPCKYYGYFLSNLCSNISILSFYTNDIQGAFHFALKSIKYEPKYCVAWKCLGDSYRSYRKFWQAKNFYDIAIYLGYKDTKGENFDEIVQELNNLTQKALKNVDLLKENMNSHVNVVIKKNIGVVINKNPDSIGGCFISYVIEGSKASKKNFHHGDQIVSLNNIITYGKPIDFCLKSFQKNKGTYDIIFFKGNIIELYGLKAYKYLMENNLFSTLFENEQILSFKRNETILFDMKGFGTFSEYGMSKSEI
ncbi:conserved Plasmodium protein, unknown function [Plasmodium gallinaceum]|uniref:PDZ domain-containing protein n=1 Tax=Plasmodium gallinaceum TaxID=5849 RepID=A0A1J1GVJ0_PLAGA|nr:conserved Plasmodium protein, unknown function [Plasmodium gallinaceum]CRG95306.1 conserved Plasmodium protein, unknown function [Plasmodium gallinaceum]